MFDFEQFKADQRAAFLSLDLAQIRAFLAKYGEQPPKSDVVLLAGIHKARTALKTLPMEARIESKQWLTERGMSSLDDGDVSQAAEAARREGEKE